MDQFWIWPTIAAVFFVSAAIFVILVRRSRFKKHVAQAALLVPRSNSVVWHLSGPSFEPAEASNGLQRFATSAGGAMIAAVPLATTVELLSPDVVNTPEPLHDHAEVVCSTQLSDYLHDDHDTIFSASSGPDFVAALERFVGEQTAGHDAIVRSGATIPVGSGVLNAAGVVSGGFIGMSLGQLLGRAFLNPNGTSAVTALLGIGGAILGRILSRRAKKNSFQAAVASLDAARASAIERIESQRRIEQTAIKQFVEERDKALREAIIEERRKVLAAVRDGRESIANERHLACEAFVSHLGEIQQRIWEGFYDFRKTHQSSIPTRWLYPREGDVAVELARRWAQDASGRVEQLHTFLWTLLSSPHQDKRNEATRVISKFIRTFDCDADRYYLRIRVHADRVAVLQQIIDEQPKVLDGRLKRLLIEAQREVNAFIDATHVRLHEHLREVVKPVFGALERVQSETH